MLGKLFGALIGKSTEKAEAVEPVEYNGYAIFAEPMSKGSQWQINGRIVKDNGSEQLVHKLIRADMMATRDEAADHTIRKAKLVIDQQGDSIFR